VAVEATKPNDRVLFASNRGAASLAHTPSGGGGKVIMTALRSCSRGLADRTRAAHHPRFFAGELPMRTALPVACLMAALLATAHNAVAQDWTSTLRQMSGAGASTKSSSSSLSQADMNGGLKEALALGSERAIKGLSRSGGFLDDKDVRIPLPGKLRKMESSLRMLGQGKAVDEFLQTANRAAEQAIPKAAPIVGDAIRGMSFSDARKILSGPDDSATRYFREKSSDSLTRALMPIVTRATDNAGVTRAFKRMVDKAGPAASMLGDDLDVDEYITEKTLDGLFFKLAEEEKSIRHDPVARSTDLLRKVFGS
jgi:ribosomal protein L22